MPETLATEWAMEQLEKRLESKIDYLDRQISKLERELDNHLAIQDRN